MTSNMRGVLQEQQFPHLHESIRGIIHANRCDAEAIDPRIWMNQFFPAQSI